MLNIIRKSALIVLFSVIFSRVYGQSNKIFAAYYPSWKSNIISIDNIKGDLYTHIIYAFTQVSNNQIALFDTPEVMQKHASQFQKLKGRYPHLKVLVAVGGWTGSKGFSSMAASDTSRKIFAQSCLRFISQYGFDGIDIDWEYPVEGGDGIPHLPSDKENYSLMIQELRSELDKFSGPRPLLTAALPSHPWFAKNFELKKLASILDFINLMTYDFYGSWSDVTGHQANLFNFQGPSEFSASDSVQYYFQQIGSKSKLVLGFPTYGRGWAGVNPDNFGIGQKFTSLPPGKIESGVFDYRDIKLLESNYQRFYDNQLVASWVYSNVNKIMITYDSPKVVSEKANFVNQNGLLGMMAWELTADDGDLALAAFNGLQIDIRSSTTTTITTTATTTATTSTTPETTSSSVVTTTSKSEDAGATTTMHSQTPVTTTDSNASKPSPTPSSTTRQFY